MSLQSLRDLRMSGKRPARVAVVLRDCPKPSWKWLKDDPSIVWLSPRSDVRAHDLRPLVGVPTTAFVDDLSRRLPQVIGALESVNGLLVGVSDGRESHVGPQHPLALMGSADEWMEAASRVLAIDWRFYWSVGGGTAA